MEPNCEKNNTQPEKEVEDTNLELSQDTKLNQIPLENFKTETSSQVKNSEENAGECAPQGQLYESDEEYVFDIPIVTDFELFEEDSKKVLHKESSEQDRSEDGLRPQGSNLSDLEETKTDNTTIEGLETNSESEDKVLIPVRQMEYQFKKTDEINNQNIYVACHKVEKRSLETARMLLTKSLQTGKLVRSNLKKGQKGCGSGILISENMFLTALHCYDGQSQYYVAFGVFENFRTKGELVEVECCHLPGSEMALKHGLKNKGDHILLQLKGSPGKNGNYTRLEEIGTEDIKELYLLSYKAGSHLKVSLKFDIKDDKEIFKTMHVTGTGSSGGIYLNRKGQIYGVHIGKEQSDNSKIALRPWQESSKEYPGNVKLESDVSITKGYGDNYTLKIREIHLGDFERGILITLSKGKNRQFYHTSSYQIPNAYLDPHYKGNANKFYDILGDSIASEFFNNDNTFKDVIQKKVFGTLYTLTLLPPEEQKNDINLIKSPKNKKKDKNKKSNK